MLRPFLLYQGTSTGDVPVIADDVTLSEAIQAAAIAVAAILLAVVLRRVLERTVDREASRHLGRVLGRFLSVVVVGVGLVYALDTLGVRIGPLVGALGIGGIAVAFAAQDLLQNFIAGVVLQVRHPFRLGDQIGSGEYEERRRRHQPADRRADNVRRLDCVPAER